MVRILSICFLALVSLVAHANDANRLTYLDDPDPFYPTRDFPKLITPQWIGEPGVEAAIILSIDDMRDPAKYEAYLRPIIDKLKEKYGTASMSIMACSVTPTDPQLQIWLKEGISIETHTVAHPCPLLGRGQFAEAKATYESCIDLIGKIPNNTPVAFRMPCCDSINSLSPRFFYEIFNKPSQGVPHLTIDSSVFNITTANDPALPREWVLREDGRERFRTYLPFPSFVTTIEDYPYPYIIGGTCWEFPCAVPSDWEAQNINKPNNPLTVADMKFAIDAAVLKKGVFTLVFHPHGWIDNNQVVELIEHAAAQYGNRVKFLSFREAHDRLSKNLLPVASLRDATGADAGTRLLDINNDGYLDVISPATATHESICRVWSPAESRWHDTAFPTTVRTARWGIDTGGNAALLVRNETAQGAWRYVDGDWEPSRRFFAGLKLGGYPIHTSLDGRDQGVRMRDIDGDGKPELLILNENQRAVFTRSAANNRWKRASFTPPSDAVLVDADGRDNGLRFVDVDGDGDQDILLSNQDCYAVHLFDSMKSGWSTEVVSGNRDGDDPATAIPAIAVNGDNNGAWLHSRQLWVQNEHTDKLPDLVDRRSFNDLTATVEPKPKSPKAALASIKVHPGLRVELVAAEPLVVDPVSIAWGPDGKLWVVEMRDYPLGMNGKGKPGSRVKFLEDLDGDGTYDKATVFLDKLPFATGVMPWRDGVLVTAAPLVFFAKDTNGDGKADLRETLFDGFIQGNQQHRVNGLRWGLDNWIHCANGDSSGAIKSAKSGETVNISGRDFRIRVDDGALESESGNSQFGICFDDWGNRFGCANWLPVWHYALDDAYMQRNPHFSPGNPREYVVKPEKLYPTSRTLARFNDFEFANKATSTCGIEIYRDTVLGDEFYGNSFVCEPVHDLVIRTVLETEGATFRGHRAPGEEESEFLSSHDNWFRPVMARTGPDGALYIVDMYRQVIEHPEYISKETQATLNLRAGHDKGRIYRVVPVHGELHEVPRLSELSTADLVSQLNSPNGTLREMAHQQLIERNDMSAVHPLRALLTENASSQARVQALGALSGLGALAKDDLAHALKDTAAGVRRNAVRLATAHIGEWPELGQALLAICDDTDPLVHIELIYALGACRDPGAADVLAKFIAQDATNPYLGMALLSSLNDSNLMALMPSVLAWATSTDAAAEARDQVIPSAVGVALAANNSDALAHMAALITDRNAKQYTQAQFTALSAFLVALKSRTISPDAVMSGTALDRFQQDCARIQDAGRAIAFDASQDETLRVSAINVIANDPSKRKDNLWLLDRILASNNPEGIKLAAVTSLIETNNDQALATLLGAWPNLEEKARGIALDAIVRNESWTGGLMIALEQGAPSFRELNAAHRQQLLNNKNDAIRTRAEKLMATAANPNRQAVIDQYREAATMPGQFLRGRETFRQRCASCHQLGTVGHAVGPDLTALTDRSPEAVLVSILDPNRAVETKYFDHTVETNDLMTYSGIVVNESGNSVTLRGANGIDNTILRANIDSITASTRSPMPDGLEDGLTPEDMANLIAYILDTRPKD